MGLGRKPRAVDFWLQNLIQDGGDLEIEVEGRTAKKTEGKWMVFGLSSCLMDRLLFRTMGFNLLPKSPYASVHLYGDPSPRLGHLHVYSQYSCKLDCWWIITSNDQTGILGHMIKPWDGPCTQWAVGLRFFSLPLPLPPPHKSNKSFKKYEWKDTQKMREYISKSHMW